jgi:hypothetical protein
MVAMVEGGGGRATWKKCGPGRMRATGEDEGDWGG